jgi:hypothetical protein
MKMGPALGISVIEGAAEEKTLIAAALAPAQSRAMHVRLAGQRGLPFHFLLLSQMRMPENRPLASAAPLDGRSFKL